MYKLTDSEAYFVKIAAQGLYKHLVVRALDMQYCFENVYQHVRLVNNVEIRPSGARGTGNLRSHNVRTVRPLHVLRGERPQ